MDKLSVHWKILSQQESAVSCLAHGMLGMLDTRCDQYFVFFYLGEIKLREKRRRSGGLMMLKKKKNYL
jgi:hypothetical protein